MNSMKSVIDKQRNFFATNTTKSIKFRIEQLHALKKYLIEHEQEIIQTLHADLHKPPFESFTAEFYLIIQEINLALKKISCWSRPHRVPTPLTHFPASSYSAPEPYGVVLIIAPWNYPFQLTLIPLIGAIAAGNCALLKPSEFAPQSARFLAQMAQNIFAPEYISVVEGDASTAQELISHRFDYIFFTGSTRVGKCVMLAAAQHLTPLTLELGGKSPTIVHEDASIQQAAKKIAWGKFLNAGQNCVAPDYVLVHSSVKQLLIEELKQSIETLYGKNPHASESYGRIINIKHFDRLHALLPDGEIISGGSSEASDRFIEPTLIDNIKPESALLHEEIFGPILPIISYESLDEALSFIKEKPKPLALYIFSNSKKVCAHILQEISSGTACINDTVLQGSSCHLPLTGVGLSGFGSYHGKKSFDTFSHYRSLLYSNRFTIIFRYPPYRQLHSRIMQFLRWWL